MAVPFSSTKLRVPKGFQNVLEAFAREILRHQPNDIFEFGMTYFENMLKVRTETGHDLAVHGARLEDRTYNNWALRQEKPDAEYGNGPSKKYPPTPTQAASAATVIQAGYRGAHVRDELKRVKEEAAALAASNTTTVTTVTTATTSSRSLAGGAEEETTEDTTEESSEHMK